MDEAGARTESKLCRKELRTQKLMEYLAAKGKLKPPNPKPYLRHDHPGRKSTVSVREPADGKENRPAAAAAAKREGTNAAKAAKSALRPTGKAHVKQTAPSGDVLTASQSVNRAAGPAVPTRPPLRNGKPSVTRTYTIKSLRAGLGTNRRPAKQPGTLARPAVPPGTVKPSRSLAQQTATDSDRTAHAKSGVTSRASVCPGPAVQTEKGAFPAGSRQRNVPPNPTGGCSARAAATTAVGADRVRLADARPAPKAHPSAALRKPFQCGPVAARAASAAPRGQPGGRGPAKPAPPEPRQPVRPPAAGKQTLTAGAAAAAAAAARRSDLTRRAAEPAGASQGKPAQKPAAGRPEAKVAGRARPATDAPGACAGMASQRGGSAPGNGRALGGGKPEAATMRRTLPPTRSTTPGPPVAPQTLPRCGARVAKTPGLQGCRAPQTEGKKSTAAQEERMRKLQAWRDTKGISYKRPPMPVRPRGRRAPALPQPYWVAMEEEEEARSLICAVDRSLSDCIKLLTEGCPPARVTEVLSRLPPLAKKFAKYWICQARLMEQRGDLDVLPMFEEAVHSVLEPVDDLRAVVFDILKKSDEQRRAKERVEGEVGDGLLLEGTPMGTGTGITPRPVRVLIQGEKDNSSAVKYKITATPGGVRSQRRGPIRVDGQEVRFLTPVRRSVRIERASLSYPASLRERDPCVVSYDHLLAEEGRRASGEDPVYVYRENEALEDQVTVRLLYDDA